MTPARDTRPNVTAAAAATSSSSSSSCTTRSATRSVPRNAVAYEITIIYYRFPTKILSVSLNIRRQAALTLCTYDPPDLPNTAWARVVRARIPGAVKQSAGLVRISYAFVRRETCEKLWTSNDLLRWDQSDSSERNGNETVRGGLP